MENYQVQFRDLLKRAVSEPGTISATYSAFHHFSIGNQLTALFQCSLRNIPVGPISTLAESILPRGEQKQNSYVSLLSLCSSSPYSSPCLLRLLTASNPVPLTVRFWLFFFPGIASTWRSRARNASPISFVPRAFLKPAVRR
jgi:hypothetical protein